MEGFIRAIWRLMVPVRMARTEEGQLLPTDLVHMRCSAHLAHLPNDFHDPAQVIGFGQKAGSVRELVTTHEDISRGNYDGNPGPTLPHAMRQFQAIHGSRHTNIGEQDINGLGARFADVESGKRVFGREGHEALIFQGLDRERAQQSFVFCDYSDKRPIRGCRRISHHEEVLLTAKVPPLCRKLYI